MPDSCIGFVHKNLIDAQFFESQGIVFGLAIRALLESYPEPLPGLFQFLHYSSVVSFFLAREADGVVEFRHLLFHKTVEILIGDWKELEGPMRNNYGVIVAGGDPTHRLLAVPRREIVFS